MNQSHRKTLDFMQGCLHLLNASLSMEHGVVAAAAFGVLAHQYFKRYEPTDLVSLTVLLGAVPAIPASLLARTGDSTFTAILTAYSVYIVSLLLSIAIYRTTPLHPLSKYPGPFLCKLSKFWLVYLTTRGKLYLYFKEAHDKYGPIVRIGPNELSIVDETLLPSIMGPDSMPKGPLWEGRRIQGKRGGGKTRGTLIGSRNKKDHAEARRVWNRAFTTPAVKKYEPIVIRRAAQLVEELRKRCRAAERDGKGLAEANLSEWLSYFSFDFMGDFVFGSSFELMSDGDKDGFLRTMASGLYLPALTQHVPWCMDALIYTPFVGKEMKQLGEFAFRQVSKRIKEGSIQDDLFYHLNDEGRESPEPPSMPLLMSNAVTAIIAGSDTTASVMSNIFFFILHHRAVYNRLQAEVDAAFPPGEGEPTDAAKLAQLEYMNAVINETLRLRPPASTSLQRAPTPGSGGHVIGKDMFIPEGTAVYSPLYVYHRDPRYFSPDTDAFRPERWLAGEAEPDAVLNMSAFIPFSIGQANCVGKPIAVLEMRLVLAYMIQAFEMRLVDSYRPEQWEEELRDFFVLQKGPLPVSLKARF